MFAARGGFVYYTVNNQISTFQPYRPASAYTVPFTVADPGSPGTALTLYGIPLKSTEKQQERESVTH